MSGPNSPSDDAIPEQTNIRRGPLRALQQVTEARPVKNPTQVDSPNERFTLIGDAIMRDWEEPPALVEGMIPEKSLSVIYGEPGSGKSFLVLDLAYSVATGVDWLGRRVQQGPVVYIAGEGVGGLAKRIRAWRAARSVDGDVSVHFMASAAQLLEKGDVEALMKVLRLLPEPPKLVIIDTLARAMSGGDENSAKDMGELIHAADVIRSTFDTAVLLVHHPTKSDPFEPRGSGALEGAADFMMAVVKLGTMLELSERKNKEYEPVGTLIARLQPHEDSCVVVYQPNLSTQRKPAPTKEKKWPYAELSEKEFDVLRVLGDIGVPLSRPEYRDVAVDKGVSNGTFYRAEKRLVELKHIAIIDNKHAITETGRKILEDYSNGIPR